MKAQTPRDNPSPVTVSEPKHVKKWRDAKEERRREAIVGKKKPQKTPHLSKYFWLVSLQEWM